MLVWVVRFIHHECEGRDPDSWKLAGYYARPFKLPCPPFVGLGLPVDEGQDPDPIKNVYVIASGALVCEIARTCYTRQDGPDDEWPGDAAYLVDGWQRLVPFGVGAYRLPLPPP